MILSQRVLAPRKNYIHMNCFEVSEDYVEKKEKQWQDKTNKPRLAKHEYVVEVQAMSPERITRTYLLLEKLRSYFCQVDSEATGD